MSSMHSEVNDLRDEGRWRGGKHTLMQVLGIHYLELPLTAGLAWLLDPDGWHGLGGHVLSGLLDHLGLPPVVAHPVTVTREEARPAWQTRADLLVRMPGSTLLFEAKVFSGEEDEQCDRLSKAWEPEAPTRVFLTLDGRAPLTAVHSRGQWYPLTWTQVGVIIRDAIDRAPDCAPGAREFLATIEMMGASHSMPRDEKVRFYLRHWQDIEEWAALRTQSLGQFEDAFGRAAEVKRGVPGRPHVEESDSAQWRWYGFELGLPPIAPARAFVALGWTHSQLFGSAGETLPYIGIKLDGASQEVLATVKELLRDAAQACHWPKSGGNWVWYGYLPFGASDTDLDAYAEKQMDGLAAAHSLVQSALPLR
jgi:PD-(D/E)XK nuclease superfamily